MSVHVCVLGLWNKKCVYCMCVTRVMLDQLLKGLKLSSSGDVISSTVQFTDFIMFHMVPFHIVPVPDRQREGTCHTDTQQKHCCSAVMCNAVDGVV